MGRPDASGAEAACWRHLRVRAERLRLCGEVLARRFHGRRTIRLWVEDGSPVDTAIDTLGHVPLPPYIRRPDEPTDRERYQTVYATVRGSVAAPTAGLHLTEALLTRFRNRGGEVARVTLHVGYGTFQPVRVDRVEEHRVEPEPYDVPAATAATVNRALDEGRRVVAVGTTTTRTLETAARAGAGRLPAGRGVSDLYLYPGVTFQVAGALFTNFHLPRSSLLMARQRLRRAGAGAGRIRRGGTKWLPVLQLRRRDAHSLSSEEERSSSAFVKASADPPKLASIFRGERRRGGRRGRPKLIE